MKKFINSIEELETLRGTDTRIYRYDSDSYYQFINGVLCLIFSDGTIFYNSSIFLDGSKYIEISDKLDESWIGKLGWVSNESPHKKERCGILEGISDIQQYPYRTLGGSTWTYFTPFTQEEVEKYTGCKIVKEK